MTLELCEGCDLYIFLEKEWKLTIELHIGADGEAAGYIDTCCENHFVVVL
jgi:hypothetical protein